MRLTVSLLLIAGVAVPSIADAKVAKARPARAVKAARAAQPAAHGGTLAAAAWVAPATTSLMAGGLMAVAVGGLSGGRGANDSAGLPNDRPTTSGAPTVSPE